MAARSDGEDQPALISRAREVFFTVLFLTAALTRPGDFVDFFFLVFFTLGAVFFRGAVFFLAFRAGGVFFFAVFFFFLAAVLLPA